MKTKTIIASLPLLVLSVLVSCDKSGPTQTTEKTCSELSASLIATAGTSTSAYQIISPNGGETFYVGDTLHVRATGNMDAANASGYLQIGSKLFRIPPNATSNLNVYSNCDMAFAIPDSLPSAIGTPTMISLVSDSVKVLVENYTDNTHRDLSDNYFSIKKH